MTHIKLSAVGKTFGALKIIDNANLAIDAGEFVVFVGPSGCGKSTLLRMIAGLEEISSGTLEIAGQVANDVSASQRGVAMVFQSYALYPHMTVARNLAFGLEMAKTSKVEIARRVAEVAELLQLTPLLDRLPKQLSGGQRQRVAIGRAIVRNPSICLFDEPLSNLDAGLRAQMRIEIARLHRRLGATFIYVTHDQAEAMTLADRIVVLNDGAVQQVGPPLELYDNPCNRFVAGFIGGTTMNFLPATVVSADCVAVGGAGQLTCRPVRSVAPGMRVVAGIRPEHVRLATPGEDRAIEVLVEAVENMGDQALIYGRLATGEALCSRQVGQPLPAVGTRVRLVSTAEKVLLFEAAGAGARLS